MKLVTLLLISAVIVNGSLFPKIAKGQPFNDTTLRDIDFVDSLNGWFVGGSSVIRTNDGGQTWHMFDVGMDLNLHTVEFVSKEEGWVGGTICCNTGDGIILHTTDGGNMWEVQYEDTLGSIQAITFINERYGWAGGFYNGILYTTDGGLTWTRGQPEVWGGDVKAISFIDSLVGFADGGGINLMTTIDGGKNWIEDSSLDASVKVFFADHEHGWAAGGGGIYRTANGGETWSFSPPFWGNGWNVKDIFFVDSLVGYLTVQPGTYRTSDGGLTWSLVSEESASDIFFTGKDVGWGASVWFQSSSQKRLAHTLDGGKTWNDIITTSVENKSAVENQTYNIVLHPNYPNPFNSETIISFEVSNKATPVKIEIFDVIGRTIVTLMDQILPVGTHKVSWDGLDTNAQLASTGLYFYQLSSEEFKKMGKMLLLK